MALSDVLLKRLVELVVPVQRNVTPGDAVVFTYDGMGGDVPLMSLTQPHPNEALEHEAFTGMAILVPTGWIRKGQICIVIAVVDDYAFVLGREGNGLGWIDKKFLSNIVEYS